MKRIPKIAALLGVFTVGCGMLASAQQPQMSRKKTMPKQATTGTKKTADGFTVLASGLQYRIVTHGKGIRNPALNDHIELNIHLHVGDSVIFDSRKMNNNKPVPLPITAAKFKGDPMEAFMLMVEGDS